MDPETQLLLSVLTLLLTPLLSALVVAFQLSKGHSYWEKQQEYIHEKDDFDLRVGLLKRTSALLNKANDTIIHHHIYASSRDIASALAKILKASNEESASFYQKEYETFRSKASESYLESRALSSQLSELAAEASVYFDLLTGQMIIAFRDKGNLAIAAPMTASEIHDRLVTTFESSRDIEASKALVAKEYDSITDSKKPIEEGRQILAEITSKLMGKANNRFKHDAQKARAS